MAIPRAPFRERPGSALVPAFLATTLTSWAGGIRWKAPAQQDDKITQILMIVEDEALGAMELRDEMQDAGYRVLNLTDRYAEALEVAKTEKPDLALVNIRLAAHDDGIVLSEPLKALGIPVL